VKIKNSVLDVLNEDILDFEADALFCPDKGNLPMASGLAQVIRKKLGEDIYNITRSLIPIETGNVVYSRVNNFSVNYIFWGSVISQNDEIDRTCVTKAINITLDLCVQLALAHVSFPMIASPRAKIPYDTFSRIILKSMFEFLIGQEKSALRVSLVIFNKEAFSKAKTQLDLLRQEYFI
jgi:O-acetyl-ADP-ribose deacetylase (regulator of RNase III)